MTKPDPNFVPNILTKAEAAAIKMPGPRFNKTSKNSLESRATYDPVLKAKIVAGRREEMARYNAMEVWAAQELVSATADLGPS